MKKWLYKHWYKLLTLDAPPKVIAMGFAIGVWWGFTPFFMLKTIMAIFCAWLARSSKIAAALAVSLHDLLWPILGLIIFWQYLIGCWLLRRKPDSPKEILSWFHSWVKSWPSMESLYSKFEPVVIGAVIIATPLAILSYFVMFAMVKKYQRTRDHLRMTGVIPPMPEE